MNINVLSVVGPYCMTYEGGQKLHDAYRAAFDAGKIVELDFTGTRFFCRHECVVLHKSQNRRYL
jgi:hypothetical protein